MIVAWSVGAKFLISSLCNIVFQKQWWNKAGIWEDKVMSLLVYRFLTFSFSVAQLAGSSEEQGGGSQPRDDILKNLLFGNNFKLTERLQDYKEHS